MILVDFSQIMIGGLMASTKSQNEISESMIRHMILNTLRSYRKKFYGRYGELVICVDGRHYWRKDYFPHYKASRKIAREKSAFDWNEIYKHFDKIKKELKETFPYKMIEVYGAEADDIIGALIKNKDPKEKVLILSSDKDFIQLHRYPKVAQFSPTQKKFVKNEYPEAYLKEHIIRGDRGDGIPNFLTDDRAIIDGNRQVPISKKKLSVWLTQAPEEICENAEMADRYQRNMKLVDLSKMPEEIENDVLEQFDYSAFGSRNKIYNYFIKNRLNSLMGLIGDF